ncbi:hypothetical protein HYH02_010569 [Chlamydomonas schloesseri]|uniref:Uncharacterized protein n=1 Tax=Chlamydomonas schloesseri TaxID=2026947 RepID=A0A835T6F9_9CHLO|nr:hypothetical protein HYH02_010569 [Chlamydomonas schloesseri]|eukprot:KAG2439689.1 hypothetical protein HYH02_010569 [Chlamydomonas schloesseri]
MAARSSTVRRGAAAKTVGFGIRSASKLAGKVLVHAAPAVPPPFFPRAQLDTSRIKQQQQQQQGTALLHSLQAKRPAPQHETDKLLAPSPQPSTGGIFTDAPADDAPGAANSPAPAPAPQAPAGATVAAHQVPPVILSFPLLRRRAVDMPPKAANPDAGPRALRAQHVLRLTHGTRRHLLGRATLRTFFPEAAEAVTARRCGSEPVLLHRLLADGTTLVSYHVLLSYSPSKGGKDVRLLGLTRMMQDMGLQPGACVRLSWGPQMQMADVAAVPAAAGGQGQRVVMVERVEE